MSKHRTVLKEVENHSKGMDELTNDIEDFCNLMEHGLSACQTPPEEINITEVPAIVAKRVVHG